MRRPTTAGDPTAAVVLIGRALACLLVTSAVGGCVALACAADAGPGGLIGSRAPGWMALCYGWVFPQLLVAWSANWFLLAATILLWCRCDKTAVALGVTATLAASTTLLVFDLDSLYLGYYLWQTAPLLLTTGAAAITIAERWAVRATGPASPGLTDLEWDSALAKFPTPFAPPRATADQLTRPEVGLKEHADGEASPW